MASRIRKSRRVEDNYLQVLPEAREASQQNPMLIDLILDNMFGYCDFKDLAQYRLVSKQWHKESLPAWLAKGPTLKLPHEAPRRKSFKPAKFWSRNDSSDSEDDVQVNRSMSGFLSLVHNEFHSYEPYEYSGLRQYRKFEVRVNAADAVQHTCFRQFLRFCGPCVTELKVELYSSDFDTYRALMLSTMTPNLVKLVAHVSFKEDVLNQGTFDLLGEEHRRLTTLQIDYSLPVAGWIQLVRRYPNLKALLLRDIDLEGVSYLRVNPQSESDGVLQTLLPLFRDGQLNRLETLEMHLGYATPAKTIADVLASQAATLKKLSIHRERPLKGFKPPELPFVESLELRGRPIRNLFLASSSLMRFRSLKSLSLIYNDDSDLGKYRPSDQLAEMLRATQTDVTECILPTLSKFHCVYGDIISLKNPVDAEGVRKLARFFPNLTDLQLWLDNKTLGTVFQSWPGLQHLTTTGDGVDDNGISGVVRDFPRMKDLKSLAMLSRFRAPTPLTDKSLSKFLKLPNLERLEISLDEQLSVGPAILRKLEQKLKTVTITRERNYHDEIGETDSDSGSDEDDDSDDSRDGDNENVD